MTKNLVYPQKSTTIKYRVYYLLDWVVLLVGFRFFLYAYVMYIDYKRSVFFSVDLLQKITLTPLYRSPSTSLYSSTLSASI
ncbi:hypothetical protein TYRP_011591 [Tyrophagus putrescentiae]|nr:hypothetical protein TYRP_011591 [Tyrophagus putrescentiae]